MSDGSSGNSFGEMLENMSTNTKKAIGGTIADFTKSAANQVKGSGGVASQQAPTLTGGDLFSPDVIQKSQQTNPKPQIHSTSQNQQVSNAADAKTPEEMARIHTIEEELAQMDKMKQLKHREYVQDFMDKAEGRDKRRQMEEQKKQADAQQEQVKKMEDMQQKQQDDQDIQKFRQARGVELAKGNQG